MSRKRSRNSKNRKRLDYGRDVLPLVDRTGKRHLWQMADSEDLLQEAKAMAYDLWRRYGGKFAPRAIAGWAVRRAKSGHTLAGGRQEHELLAYCRQAKHGYRREPFLAAMRNGPQVPDATPAFDFQQDFAAWLRTLLPRERIFLAALADGAAVPVAARQVGVSHRTGSRLRAKLWRRWKDYTS